jgi:hypothetical protein
MPLSVAELEAENARLRRELAEALEQQTAASEVLRVISGSPGELHSVFQPMLTNAIKLCEGTYGAMWLRQGDSFRNAGFHGPLPADTSKYGGALRYLWGPRCSLARLPSLGNRRRSPTSERRGNTARAINWRLLRPMSPASARWLACRWSRTTTSSARSSFTVRRSGHSPISKSR